MPDSDALLAGCSPSVMAEYERVAPRMGEVLSGEEYALWVEYGARLGQGTGVSGQMAVEYFRASALLIERWPFQYLPEWAATGETLAATSPQVAAAYFRATPEVLAHLRAKDVSLWGNTCARVFKSGWQSGALAAQLFEMSPDLLRYLDLTEMGMLADLLQQVAAAWYPAARQCLALAVELLPEMSSPERQRVIRVASALAERSATEVREWLTHAGHVVGQLDNTSRSPLLALAAGLAKEGGDATSILAFLRNAGDKLGPFDARDQARFLGYAGRIGDVSAHAAEDFLRSSPTLAGRVEGEGLDAWVREGLTALRDGDASGRAYFRLESARAMSQLRELSPAVELASVAELLRLYCTALTGTQVQVQPTSHLVQRGIGWAAEQRPTTEGSSIFLPDVVQAHESWRENFDRLKVYAVHQGGHLEFESFRFQFEREGTVFPTSRFELERRRRVISPVTVTVAGANLEAIVPVVIGDERFSTDMERFFRLFSQRRLAQDVFTLMEDARIDARIQHEYAGIRKALRVVQEEERVLRQAQDERPSDRTALLEAILQATIGYGASPGPSTGSGNVPPKLQKHFKAAWDCITPLLDPTATVEDAAEATVRVYLIVTSLERGRGELRGAGGNEIPIDDDFLNELMALQSSMGHSIGDLFDELDGEDDGTYEPMEPVDYRGDFKPQLVQTIMKLKEGQAGKMPAPRGPVSMDELKKLLERMDELELNELSESELGATTGMFITNLLRETGHGEEEDDGSQGPAFRAQPPQVEGPLTRKAPNEYLYPEWDFRAGAYRPDWCLVREKVLDEGAPEYYDLMLTRYGGLARAVRRQFQALRPELFKKIKHLPDGEEYDLDQVVTWAVDRKAKLSPSEKLYWRRNKIERSVAVALLLDVSASTDEDAKKEPRPAEDWSEWDQDSDRFLLVLRERLRQQEAARRNRRRIIDVERESAVLLVQALEELGDAYGVYGFSGYGRDGVEVYVVKDFHEPFGVVVKGRVGNLEPVRGTRMGAAIRHVSTKLEAWEARTKLLLLVSDGRPQDHDYGRDRTERDYALHDTRKALLEARQKRIVPFALTVDREGHDYLKTICAGIGYEVVDDIEALPTRLPAIYRELAF